MLVFDGIQEAIESIGDGFETVVNLVTNADEIARTQVSAYIQGGYDLYSTMATSAADLLRMSPDEWSATGWSAMSTANTAFMALGCTLVVIFWCIRLVSDNIDIRQTMRAETMVKEGVLLIVAEWFVCNCFEIFTMMFGFVDYLTAGITDGTISPTPPDSVVTYLESMSFWQAMLSSIPAFIYLLIMIYTGAQILYFAYIRFFKVMIVAPYGSLVMSTIAGPNSISHSSVGFFKYALSTILEAVTMILILKLGAALYSSSIIGLPPTSDVVDSLSFIKWIACECIISFVISGAIKEAPIITQRALGA